MNQKWEFTGPGIDGDEWSNFNKIYYADKLLISAVEAQFLKDRGLSDLVILSFLRTRRLTSCKFFHRTWMARFALGEVRKFNA